MLMQPTAVDDAMHPPPPDPNPSYLNTALNLTFEKPPVSRCPSWSLEGRTHTSGQDSSELVHPEIITAFRFVDVV